MLICIMFRTYTPDEEANRFCTCWEEGNIFMRIDVTEGDGCSPPFTVDFDFCYDHFRTIIDGCNTGGENGKKLEAVCCFTVC